jgi:hypothetical protein
MQVPSDEQGGGAGRSRGPGPLSDMKACLDTGSVVAGAKDAAARPAIATSRANTRIAEFIFSNLTGSIQKKKHLFLRANRIARLTISPVLSLV